jgi:DNA-binding CsgD family transcriptional regulator
MIANGERSRRLFGRSGECAALAGLVEDARCGNGAALVLRGEPGVGRTALVEHAVELAAGSAAELRVVRAAGREAESELTYAGLHQLCATMLGPLDRLPQPQREALEIVFGTRSGLGPDRLLVGVAVLSLLTQAAAERPLVGVVDDAQWLDQASLQALAFASRRLTGQSALVIFTVREPAARLAGLPELAGVPELAGLPATARLRELAGLPELAVGRLSDADARELLDSVVRWPLDARAREQIVLETRGNPAALLGLLRGLSPGQLAGGFRLPGAADGIPGSLLGRLDALPAATGLLLLTAAADPTGDPALVRRAAGRLEIPPEAADQAIEAGLVTFGRRVVFGDPAVRSAVYWSAPLRGRRAVHQALAWATHSQDDPDRRAWHQSHARSEPDAEVAAELERTAVRAQARGGLAACAAFLERSALMTPDVPDGRQSPDSASFAPTADIADPPHPVLAFGRPERSLTAAAAMLAAGDADAAAKLLDAAEAGGLDDHRRADAGVLRARLALAVNRGGDASRVLLDAARQLDRFDAAEARLAYLDAISATMLAGSLAVPGGTAADVAGTVAALRTVRAGQAGPAARAADVTGTPDLLLDGLTACLTEEYQTGAPTLRRALGGFGPGLSQRQQLRLLPLASAAALCLWDDRAWDTLSSRRVRVARDAGALADLPLALASLATRQALAGELAAADSLADEARVAADAAHGPPAPYGALAVAAIRGRREPAVALIDDVAEDAALRAEGFGLAAAKWATAVLGNGLGHYGEALAAAEEAVGYAGQVPLAGWALAELIEAAARTDQPGRAAAAMRRLSRIADAAGTDWALGVRARSLAMLSSGETADGLYRAAIAHLGWSRARVDLARAHLLYGEWLRREGRRVDARAQLRSAHEMLAVMGADGFAERARRELLATGETARKRTVETAADLTAQELQIALRARDGQTNPEIGAELFLSARTVEWHLHKVFAKLGVTSRRQLRSALPGPAAVVLAALAVTLQIAIG